MLYVFVSSLRLALFEDSYVDWSSHYMSLNIFVSEHTKWVNIFKHPSEIIEGGVEFSEGVRLQSMGFRPMRTASVTRYDAFVSIEQLSIWDIEAVWLVLDYS